MAIFLSEDDVRRVLTMPMALEAVESAHRDLALGQASDTPRARTRLPGMALHILQGALPAQGVCGYKAYTSHRDGNRFLVHLFDARTSRLQAVVEADFLGMMRTGAASGVAARWLAGPNARVAGVFGAGWQAEGHILALCAVRPLERIKVFARDRERLTAFCQRLGNITGIDVTPAASPQETVEGSHLVGTVTTSANPLFDAQWLAPGAHINAAGANALIRREIPEAAVGRAALVCVDSLATALAEAGDLFPALEKGRLQARQLVELGEVILGRRPGRAAAEDITLFESQGLAVQDLALARRVVAVAQEKGLGTALPWG